MCVGVFEKEREGLRGVGQKARAVVWWQKEFKIFSRPPGFYLYHHPNPTHDPSMCLIVI